MRKVGDKYILKESELKVLILKEMLLTEGNLNPQELAKLQLFDIDSLAELFKLLAGYKEAGDKETSGFLEGILAKLGYDTGANGGNTWNGTNTLPMGISAIKAAEAAGPLSSKQTTFINAIYPTLFSALQRNGISTEFTPVLIAQAARETGWRLTNTLAVKANNLTGITAPGSRGKSGYKDLVLPTGGVGGRPSIWEPPGVKGDSVRWYTVFRDVNDWADYYVGDLLNRQYRAFDNGVEGFGRRLFIEGRPDGRGFYGGQNPERRANYANYLTTMHYRIKQYLDSQKIGQKV